MNVVGHWFKLLTATCLFFACGTSGANGADIAEIEAVRASSNQAILDRDIEGLRSAWTPDLHVTTSIGVVAQSADDMARMFSQAFSDTSLVTYHRATDYVRLSPGGTFAAEGGTWTGRWKELDGESVLEGVYLAQWRKTEAGWRIRSELFVTLACSGGSRCQTLP